jgi:hypothetical protein
MQKMPTVSGITICGIQMYDMQLAILVMLDRVEGLYYWLDSDISLHLVHGSELLIDLVTHTYIFITSILSQQFNFNVLQLI